MVGNSQPRVYEDGVDACGILCLSTLTAGCVATSQEVYGVRKAEIEEKCRLGLGWYDSTCKFLDANAAEAGGRR